MFQSFVIRHRLLTERLIKQGFCYSKLCKFFKKFVRIYYALFSKYGFSVRTHVHEGICIPLVVKHELSKHCSFKCRLPNCNIMTGFVQTFIAREI